MRQTQTVTAGAEPLLSDGPKSSDYARRAPALQAKGSCWYCDRPLDNIKRFCSIACRDSYFDEEWTISTPEE